MALHYPDRYDPSKGNQSLIRPLFFMRGFRPIITLGFLFILSVSSQAQMILEYGPTWNKATILNPDQYRSKQQWGRGFQAGLWLGSLHDKPNRIRVGLMAGKRETYYQRTFPYYTTENLQASVTRNTTYFSVPVLFERRIRKFQDVEWLASVALGPEFQVSQRQSAEVTPGGATPGSVLNNFFPLIKASALVRTSVVYHPSPRWSVGAEASYGTHLDRWLTRSHIRDKYVPQTLGLNLRVGYYVGEFKIPAVR